MNRNRFAAVVAVASAVIGLAASNGVQAADPPRHTMHHTVHHFEHKMAVKQAAIRHDMHKMAARHRMASAHRRMVTHHEMRHEMRHDMHHR